MRSLILSVDSDVGPDILDLAVAHYSMYDVEIIISSISPLSYTIQLPAWAGKVVSSPPRARFSLSEARNQGAFAAKGDVLIFSDVDTFASLRLPSNLIVRGVKRRDLTNGVFSEKYQCSNSPLQITRDMFMEVGGYCEEYSGWGYEDSDFEHKWPVQVYDFDAEAIHIQWIHTIVSNKPSWARGSDANREIFDRRMKLSREERVKIDRAFLEAKYIKKV